MAAADAECERDHRLLTTAVALEQNRFADTGPELTGWIRELGSRRPAALPKARELIGARELSRLNVSGRSYARDREHRRS